MFWRMGFAHTSPIDSLLDTDDFTLQQLLEEEDIIQECKQLNKKLIDYLACPQQVEALIDFVVREPPVDNEGKVKFIYPYKSSEVLAADLGAVHDCMFAHEALLDKLFALLEREAPLNTLLAGYFGKIVSTLLSRRPDETLKVIESKNVVPQLLRHLGAHSILELLLKLVAEAEEKESDGGAQMEWLHRQDLVGKLIAKLDPAEDCDVHAHSAVALVGFIQQRQQMHWSASLPSAQSRFTSTLIASESVSELLERLLKGSPSTLEHGLAVLVELVRHSTNAARGGACATSSVVVEVVKRMPDLVQVLRSPPPTPAIVNSTGTLDPPLGQNRFKILEVFYLLVALKDPEVYSKMIELGVLPTVLDLFFKYEWNNFLHNLVKNLLEIIITGEDRAMKEALLTDGNILTRIIDAHKRNDEAVRQPKSCRKGYMGQLRLISNLIQEQARSDAWILDHTTSADWATFCDTYLAQLNDINDRNLLGRSKPNGVGQQSDDNEEEEALSLPLDNNFEFRSPEQLDELFERGDTEEHDYDPDADGDAENEMDVDANDSIEEDAELAALAEGVSSLTVDVSPASPSKGKGAAEGDAEAEALQPDSPDYNDINFWKPSMNWYSK